MKVQAYSGLIEFCCAGMSNFHGHIENSMDVFSPDGNEVMQISYGAVSGYREAAFSYCPFCGEKITVLKPGQEWGKRLK